MRCAMCGYDFEPSQLVCHSSCPLGAHCMVICCPRCGYSTVDSGRSKLARRVLRLLGQEARQAGGQGQVGRAHEVEGGPVCLLDMERGQGGTIAEVGIESAAWAYLSRYGLLAGTPLRLVQKRPVPVVRVGETELAIESSIAAGIYVEPATE